MDVREREGGWDIEGCMAGERERAREGGGGSGCEETNVLPAMQDAIST